MSFLASKRGSIFGTNSSTIESSSQKNAKGLMSIFRLSILFTSLKNICNKYDGLIWELILSDNTFFYKDNKLVK